jgi:hypothetical protein
MSEKVKEGLNEWAGILSIAALLLSPMITYTVSQAIHGQRIATLESEVVSLRTFKDVLTTTLNEINQRLARIEAKLEK